MKYSILLFFTLLSISLAAQETSHICAGSTKVLTASVTGGTAPITYTWTSPAPTTTTGATVTANLAGTYTWNATDATGCTATGTHLIVYEADPTASIVINATNICINTAQTISATGVPAGYTYAWDFGAGAAPATATTASNSVSYSTTGTKTITLTITKTNTGTANGCSATCTWVKTTTITVGSLTGTSSCN